MNNDDEAKADESPNNPDAKTIDEVQPFPFVPGSQRALYPSELTEEEFQAIMNAKVPEEHDPDKKQKRQKVQKRKNPRKPKGRGNDPVVEEIEIPVTIEVNINVEEAELPIEIQAENQLEDELHDDFAPTHGDTFVSVVADEREKLLADVDAPAEKPKNPTPKRKRTKIKDLVKFRRQGRW